MKREFSKISFITIICASLIAMTGCGSENAVSATDEIAVEDIQSEQQGTDEEAGLLPEASGDTDNATSYELHELVRTEYDFTPWTGSIPESVQESSVFVEKIDNLPSDFIRGMDISSLLSEEASSVKYYSQDGEEQDLLQILADSGVNCVRVRVWNDPFDEDGHGYGGGNCTAKTAAEIGKRAAEYGITLSVDFHYSDFWADPAKQMEPKAWEGMSLDEKAGAIYEYTYNSLIDIINAGAYVSMVQIGNEINSGMAGVTGFDNVTVLLKSASKAIRDVQAKMDELPNDTSDIKIAVHYTNIDNTQGTIEVAKRYAESELDYDVFGVSYYPYWHGDMENLQNVLTTIHDEYGVDTCIMETAYMYTTEDGDGFGNSVSSADAVTGYPVSIQGQTNAIRDICNIAAQSGALGIFYWEGAWIPVGKDASSNSKLWEEFGSGWASSYASDYDPKDAGQYYGGCSWDNQAFFDADGKALDSINVFKYIYCGAKGDKLEALEVINPEISFLPGDELVLPDAVEAMYNDTSVKDKLVVDWNPADIKKVDMNVTGEYTVSGTAKGYEGDIFAYITVANVNFVINPGFEDEDTSMWKVTSYTDEDPTDYQNKSADAFSGAYAFHYWSEKDMEFELSQEIENVPAGEYIFSANIQGGDFGDDTDIHLFVKVLASGEEKEYVSDTVMPDGWVNWKNPVIKGIEIPDDAKVTVGVYTKACAKAWATYDDFTFGKN